jgi:hypothetical protein
MAMIEHSLKIALTFPPRALRPEEREVLAAWLETPGNCCSAYPSDRHSDDPMLCRTIVVATAKNARPTHLLRTPSGLAVWIVQRLDTGKLTSFSSLCDALNSIWPGASCQKAKRANMTGIIPEGSGSWPRLRLVSDGERELVKQWAAAASNVMAYISQRRGDEPGLCGQVVVVDRKSRRVLYSVYGPEGSDFWVVLSAFEMEEIGRFPTLRVALNFVRPVPADMADNNPLTSVG